MLLVDKLTIDSKREYTTEGYLKVPATIARVGVQAYTAKELGLSDREPNEILYIYRSPDEVFNEESLQSFAAKPVTDNHPPELVNATNFKKYAVGYTSEKVETLDRQLVNTFVYITDAGAIKSVEAGKCELSNGYMSDIDYTPGISPEGHHYDGLQRNIRGNHVAIVEKGRAGSACRLADNLPQKEDNINMAKVTIDGVDYEVSEQASQAINKVQRKLADAEKETAEKDEELKKKEDEMEEQKEESKKTEDSLNSEIESLKAKVPTLDVIDKSVQERSTLIEKAKLIDSGIEWQGKTNAEIRKAIVESKNKHINLDGASESYIKGIFDTMVATIEANPQTDLDKAFSDTATQNADEDKDTRSPSQKARDKFVSDTQQLWKTGGAK